MPTDGSPDSGRGESSTRSGFSRRLFLASGAVLGAGATLSGESAGESGPGDRGKSDGGSTVGASRNGADLLLVNGKIHTMDPDDSVVSSVAIENNQFLAVGDARRTRGPDTEVIDLQGHTVTPGIIDNHNHIVAMGLRSGYHTPLENASSIAEVQATLQARRPDVPDGRFITTIGGFNPIQFDEGRLPTASELDAAVPDRPVYIQVSFRGPATTNSLGKSEFEDAGVTVGADGSIAEGDETGRALLELRDRRTFEDKLRSTRDAMACSTQVGVTSHLDQGAFPATGDPGNDGAAHADLYEMHEPFLTLYRDDELDVRLQLNFLNLETDPDVPKLRARLNNSFELFGDEMLNTGGIGEFTAGTAFELFVGPPSEAWKNGTELVAKEGWRNENHSLSSTDFEHIIEGWEEVNRTHDITGLRWVLAHANAITNEYVDRLDALGGGLSLTGYQYLGGPDEDAGPPFPMILDSGIRTGMSSDSAQIAPLNPWLHMYYAVTGRDAAGNLINDGNQISREEVLRLYTAENAWFLREDRLGTIEAGNLADLVVLNDDYFSVSNEAIKDIRSILTVVDGGVVHDGGVLT